MITPGLTRKLTRRQFIKWLGGGTFGGGLLGGYGFGVEPLIRLHCQHARIPVPVWPPAMRLKIAALADIHACEPWMTARRLQQIVSATLAEAPDLIVLLGDYVAGLHHFKSRDLPPDVWAAMLGQLRAPLGVHAVLGNHDWWSDPQAQRTRRGPIFARLALERAGIPVYENDRVVLGHRGRPLTLVGLGDQLAFLGRGRNPYADLTGVDDLDGALTGVSRHDPVVLLAHEPDIFPRVPDFVTVTLSGHTHGGQVRLFNYSPMVPSRYGNRYAYGHIVERGRHLVVSGGLGCSIAPVRFGVPPEINLITLYGSDTGERSRKGRQA